MKKFIYIGLFIGSYAGSAVPSLWGGGGMFSIAGLFFGTVFSIAGAIVGKIIYEKFF